MSDFWVFNSIIFDDSRKHSTRNTCWPIVRKTFGNRWNNTPHFTFPEGEAYLFPYFEDPVRYDPLPYYYYGFILYLNDGRSLDLEYLNKDYLYCREEDIPFFNFRFR